MNSKPLDRTSERRALRFMAFGVVERRNGRWRFGTATIGKSVVDRLVTDGKARIEGDRVVRMINVEQLSDCQRPEGI